MDPSVNPQALAMLQALQGQGMAPDMGMPNAAQQQAALGAAPKIPTPDMYGAMMQAPPMTPSPAPIY